MDDFGADDPEGKGLLRAWIRARRRLRPDAARMRAAADIAEHARSLPLPDRLDGLTVTCFLSLATEPGTGPLTEALLSRGASVLVPRVAGAHLDWLQLTPGQQMEPGPFGILEPVGQPVGRDGGPLPACTALFLPALAIDERGYRLGQGGGFYDRALADLPAHDRGGPIRVAIVFGDEILPRVPTEAHDCRVDLALTDAGVRRFRNLQ